MDRRCCWAVFAAVLLFCVTISGCGGGNSNTGTSTTTTTPTSPLDATTASLANGTVGAIYFVSLNAKGGTPPYTWSQTSGGPMPGGITFSAAGNFTGTPTTAGTFGPYVFTVTDANTTAASTGNLSITITGTALSVTTTSLPAGTVNTAYSATLAASGGAVPYAWTETSGGALPPGLTLATSGTISGTPTTTGVYGPYVFTATDAGSTTAASGNISITINATAAAVCTPLGNESALASTTPYAFLVKGSDQLGSPIDIAGSFTPNGTGGITAAVVDYNGFSNGPQQLQVNLAASSYAFATNGQGCLYLAFSGLVTPAIRERVQPGANLRLPVGSGRAPKPAISATVVPNAQFAFVLGGAGTPTFQSGRIIESDFAASGTSASGFMHVQTPAAFASGLSSLLPNYAFGVDGWTGTSSASVLRTALAGTFTNTSGTLSAGYADLDVGGIPGGPSGELSGGHGVLNSSVDAGTGRGTGSLFLTTPNGPLTIDFAFYILNASDMILLSTDAAASNPNSPLLAGRVLASSPTYPAGPLSGTYILALQALQTTGTAIGNLAEIGTLSATTAGAVAATIYANDAGTFSTTPYTNASYTVEAASGRVSLTGLTANPPVVYLTAGATSDDAIVGFLVGTDAQTSSGVLVAQSAVPPPYTAASVIGNWAASTAEDVDGANGAFLGAFNFTPGAYTVTSLTTGTVPNIPNLQTVAVNADGSGNLDGGNFPFVTNGQTLFAIPDSGDPLLFVFTAGLP